MQDEWAGHMGASALRPPRDSGERVFVSSRFHSCPKYHPTSVQTPLAAREAKRACPEACAAAPPPCVRARLGA